MPMYRFECDNCGAQDSVMMTFAQHDEVKQLPRHHVGAEVAQDPGELRPVICGVFRQVYGVNVNLGMREHYSDQLDTVVRSDAHFHSELSRQQDEMSARMGFDVNYDTIDPSDPAAAGVTEAGLESTERAEHAIKNDGHKTVFS